MSELILNFSLQTVASKRVGEGLLLMIFMSRCIIAVLLVSKIAQHYFTPNLQIVASLMARRGSFLMLLMRICFMDIIL